jgi:VanZ family protein
LEGTTLALAVMPSRKQLGWLVAALGVVLVAGQTLVPQTKTIGAALLPRFRVNGEGLAGIDILLNLLLFVPIGVGVRLTGCPRKQAVAIAATMSGVIEILQFSAVSGRDSSARDFLFNTLGAGIGVLLADGWKRLAFPSFVETRRLLAIAAAGWLLVVAAEAALLARSFPPTIWYGQWAPEEVYPATFSGRVLAVRLDDRDVPAGKLPDPARVRSVLRQDRWNLIVEATSGRPTLNLGSVFSIFDAGQREMIVIGQQGIDLFVRYRTRAATVGLRTPSLGFPGVFAVPPGEPIRISLAFDRGMISVTTDTPTKTEFRAEPVTPAWGWSLLSPFDGSIGPHARLWGWLWLASLLFPTGYWMGRGIGALKAVTIGGFLILVGIGLTPLMFQLPPARPWEWIASTAGLGTAWWLGRAGRRIDPGRPDSGATCRGTMAE